MDVNEALIGHRPPGPEAPGGEAEDRRPGLLSAARRGAKTAMKWVSCVAGLFYGLFLILGLLPTAFGLGAGRGWGLTEISLDALALYSSSVLGGGIIGAMCGVIGALIVRTWPRARRISWWTAARRPIRLFRRRTSVDASIDVEPPGRRRRYWPLLLGTSVLLAMLAAYGVGVYLGRQVDRRLADAIAAADRDDPYWRLDDLMAHREAVPDAENSALVVAEGLAQLPERWPAGPAPPPGRPAPPPSEALRSVLRLERTPDNIRLDDATADTLRGELEEYSDAVRIARTVADYRRGSHAIDPGAVGVKTVIPETLAARNLGWLLEADAAIRAHDGDPDGALDSCRAILAIGCSVGDEPVLNSQLFRSATGTLATRAVRRVLGQGEPSDAALARIQALILDEIGQPLLLRGLQGERAAVTEVIGRVIAGKVPISALTDNTATVILEGHRTAVAPWGRLILDNQRALSLEWLNQAVSIARRPTAEHAALWRAWRASIDRAMKRWHSPYTQTLPLQLASALYVHGPFFARNQAELGATAILIAAERHRLRTGGWPASIAAIDRETLPTAPADPCSARDFLMKRPHGQWAIYSIGPNSVDERGAYDPKTWDRGGPDDVGAIGWDVNLRRRPSPPDEERAPRRTSRSANASGESDRPVIGTVLHKPAPAG